MLYRFKNVWWYLNSLTYMTNCILYAYGAFVINSLVKENPFSKLNLPSINFIKLKIFSNVYLFIFRLDLMKQEFLWPTREHMNC